MAFAILMGCGASTELDDFSGGVPPDGGLVFDVGPDAHFPRPGEQITEFTGRTDMDGTFWARPFDCSGVVSDPGHAYSVVTFTNPNTRPLSVTIDVEWAGFDGYLHVYSRFDAGRPGDSCLAVNDDFMGTGRSRLTNIRVPTRGSISIVLSSFSQGDAGRFTAQILAE